MVIKVFPGEFASLADIANFVVKSAESAGLDDNAVYAVQLAVDEACSNIIEHAYTGEDQGNIEIECVLSEEGLEIIIQDYGKSFNPDEVLEPKTSGPLEELGSRGAGLFLMRKMMDEVHFDFERGKGNRLWMKKKKKKSE